MSLLVSILQFYFYISWMMWNFIVQYVFPLRKSFYSVFPQKVQIQVHSVQLIDTLYQKKISYNPEHRLTNIVRHPSYHDRSFVLIEYEAKNLERLSGEYIIILRGNDKESLQRVSEYLEKTDLFVDYMNTTNGLDRFIDCQFHIPTKDVQFDKTTFFNRLLGIDRHGHHFLFIHHELITVTDIWKIICIMEKNYQWYSETIELRTLDESLQENKYLPDQNFFLQTELH